MPSLAKAYIAMIASRCHSVDCRVLTDGILKIWPLLLFFALAMIGSAMKIRLPGIKTTIP